MTPPESRLISRRRVLGGMAGVAGVAGLGLVPGLLAACGSGQSTGSPTAATSPGNASASDRAGSSSAAGGSLRGSTTLGSFFSDPLPRAAMNDLIAAFSAESGYGVEVNTVATADFQNRISTYLQGTPEDVFTWFAGNRMRFFAAQGLATPIDEVWSKVQSNFPEGVRLASTGTDRKPYLVPFHTYPWVVLHRRSVWEQRGYEQPATFDDLLALAGRIRQDGLIPFAFGDQDGWPAMGTFDILNLRLNGYDFHLGLAEGGQLWTDRRVRDVFEAWRRLLPFQQRGALGRTWQEAAAAMINGDAAMYFAGTTAGEQTDEAGRADLEMFPFPAMGSAFDAEHAIDAPINGFMLSRAPKETEAANAFLEFVAGGTAQVIYVTKNPNRIAVALDADTSGYTAYQRKMAATIAGAGRLAQFLDRDSRPDFTGPTGMQRFLQDFLTDPTQDLDAFLGRIQAFWDSLA